MKHRTGPGDGASRQTAHWQATFEWLLAASLTQCDGSSDVRLAIIGAQKLWHLHENHNEPPAWLERATERLVEKARQSLGASARPGGPSAETRRGRTMGEVRRQAAERVCGRPLPTTAEARGRARDAHRTKARPVGRLDSQRRPVAPRRTCGGRRRPAGRRVLRSTAASGDSGDTSGGEPAALPRWFRERHGHLAPQDQLEALHRLPERDRQAVHVYIAVAAEAQQELAPGLRPVGLSIAEYISDLRGRS